MYHSSGQTAKFNTSNSLLQTHLSHQINKKQPFSSGVYTLSPSQKQDFRTERKNSFHEEEIQKLKRERSLSINIKSNTRQLIESKEYEHKQSNEWDPVFPEFNQQESVDITDSEQGKKHMYEKMIHVSKSKATGNFTPISQKNFKRAESKWLQDQVQKRSQSSEQFVKSPDLFTSSQDVQKLSQIYNEFLLKSDSKTIKDLNSTNQQLKGICKEIVSLLRIDPTNHKRKINDDLIISKIYKIITNYQTKPQNVLQKQ